MWCKGESKVRVILLYLFEPFHTFHIKRFGIVHVDFHNQARTPKSSAHWYRDLIQKGEYTWEEPG